MSKFSFCYRGLFGLSVYSMPTCFRHTPSGQVTFAVGKVRRLAAEDVPRRRHHIDAPEERWPVMHVTG